MSSRPADIEDVFTLEAARAVDNLTPGSPSIAPPVESAWAKLCAVQRGSYYCTKPLDHEDAYHRGHDGTLWFNEHEYTYTYNGYRNPVRLRVRKERHGTGPRPPDVTWNAASQEFVLPDGSRVPVERVERTGWKQVLAEIIDRKTLAENAGASP